MRIAYIELDTHAEIAANFRELMLDSADFDVDFYLSEKILNTLGLQPSKKVIKANPQHLVSLLTERQYDSVIIGTAHRYFDVFYKVTRHFKTSVIVHNKNFSKLSKLQLLSKIFKKERAYRLKLLLKEGLLLAPEVYHLARYRIVLDESMADGKHTYCPLFYSKFNTEWPQDGTRHIVVPGAVSQKRRDYRHILSTLKKFRLRNTLEITLAGKAASPELEWLQDFNTQQRGNISIRYFTAKIPQKYFETVMKTAQVLWCPVQRETEFFSTPEIYGETKMSGNIGDAIKFSKPAIFPRHYASGYSFVFNESDDLEAQLEHIRNHPAINLEDFSRENVQRKLSELLRRIAG